MNILMLTNLVPYPLDNGGKIKTYTTLQALGESGSTVDLVCFNEGSTREDLQNVLKICGAVKTVHHRLTTSENKAYMAVKAFRSLFSNLSFSVYKYKSKKMTGVLERQADEKQYDVVYIEHLQLCVYFKLLKKKCPKAKFILDEQNCEYLIMERSCHEATNVIKKVFLKIEYKKLKWFEQRMVKKTDGNIFLTEEDCRCACRDDIDKIKSTIIPIGIKPHNKKRYDVHNDSNKNSEKINLLFIGTMTWMPNSGGLIWFLKNVIPELYRNNISFDLEVVGKSPCKEIIDLARNDENIHIRGYVQSVEEYFEKCDCMVVPLFIGSGQRVKILEAFSRGFPVISTTIGSEGIEYKNNENILIADDVHSFIQCIKKIKNRNIYEKIAEKSYETYKKLYSYDAVKKRMIANIKKVQAE